MTEGDIYETVRAYAGQQKIAYVHLRNVRGKVPTYKETFIDEGDVNILKVLQILKGAGFRGVIIPDHAPQMTCSAPWHAGMAFALGYILRGPSNPGRCWWWAGWKVVSHENPPRRRGYVFAQDPPGRRSYIQAALQMLGDD